MEITLNNIINIKKDIMYHAKINNIDININVLDIYKYNSEQIYSNGHYYILNFKFKLNDIIPEDIIEKGYENIDSGLYFHEVTNFGEYSSIMNMICNFKDFVKILQIVIDIIHIEKITYHNKQSLSLSKLLHPRLSTNVREEISEDIIFKIMGYF